MFFIVWVPRAISGLFKGSFQGSSGGPPEDQEFETPRLEVPLLILTGYLTEKQPQQSFYICKDQFLESSRLF